MRRDVGSHLERRIGRRIIPLARNRIAALISDTSIVRRKRRRQHEPRWHVARRKTARRNRLVDAMRRLPAQANRRGRRLWRGLLFLRIIHSLLGLREFELDWIRS